MRIMKSGCEIPEHPREIFWTVFLLILMQILTRSISKNI